MMIRVTSLAAILLYAAVGMACSGDTPVSASPAAIVTFTVGNETFRVALTTADQITAARAAHNGGPARIPAGRIVAGTQVNTGWTWHLEEITFAEVTIELCDGRPSDVEQTGVTFGGGRFCPWTAAIVRIE